MKQESLYTSGNSLGRFLQKCAGLYTPPAWTNKELGELCKRIASPGEIDASVEGSGKPNSARFHLLATILVADPVEQIMLEAFAKIRALKLPMRQYQAHISQSWTIDGFLQETKLPSFLFSTLYLSAEATTIDPGSIRLKDTHINAHKIDIVLNGLQIDVSATGAYRRHLLQFADVVKPDEPILSNEYGESRFSKLYGSEIILPGFPDPRLRDLKKMSKMLEEISLSGNDPITGYAITMTQARALLEQELVVLEEHFYKNSDKDSLNKPGESMEKWLARNPENAFKRLFGESWGRKDVTVLKEFRDKIEFLVNPADAIRFLEGLGYHQVNVRTEDLMSEELASPYSNWTKQRLLKRHLLEFYKQLYQRNPQKAIQAYRESYAYSPRFLPTLSLSSSETRDSWPLIGFNSFRLGSKSKLDNLSIEKWDPKEGVPSSESEDFTLRILDLQETGKITLYIETPTHNSELLPIQEWACGKLGIRFPVS